MWLIVQHSRHGSQSREELKTQPASSGYFFMVLDRLCVFFLFFSKKWQHAKSITRNNNNNHFSSLKAVHHIYLELQNNLFNRSQVNIFLTSKMYKLAKKSTEYRFVSVFQWKPCRFSWRPESLLPLRGEKQFKWPPETSPKPVVIHFIKTWMKSMPGCERGITDGKKVECGQRGELG